MSSRQIDQKRWDGERRQTTRATTVRSAYRVGYCTEPANTGADDRRSAFLILGLGRLPSGLRQRLACRFHGKQDEAIHLFLLFGWRGKVRIETGLDVLRRRWHHPGDPGRQICAHRVRQIAQTRAPGEQALPDNLDVTAQRRNQTHTGDNNSTLTHTAVTSDQFL